MKKPAPVLTQIFICLVVFVTFSSAQSTNTSKAIKFSSLYTNLATDCRDKFKSVGEGQDMPFVCKGYGGYKIHIDFSASNEHYRVEKGETTVPLFAHLIGRIPAKKIEWRMANGKPFAIIARINKYEDPGDYTNPKKTGQFLIIKGLAGYEHIDFEVDASSAKANAEARKMADSNLVNK